MDIPVVRKGLGADELRPYRVDLGGDVYTRVREAQGFVYDDALCEVGEQQDKRETVPLLPHLLNGQPLRLFMPGCALAGYSRELTLAVYEYLREAGEVDGLSVICCGKVLDFVATPGECAAYAGVVAARLAAHGVTRIVTACPNCYQAYTALAGDGCGGQEGRLSRADASDTSTAPPFSSATSTSCRIEVLAVSEVLARRGVRFGPSEATPFTSVCVHDSCPSRTDGVFAHSVRSLFEGVELREMAHSQTRARCCGQGKLLPLGHPEQSKDLANERLAESAATGAECLVTYCTNCAQVLRGASQPSYHYLELLFGIHIDWDAVTIAWQKAQRGHRA
ncbi:MAG: (Fe-S)-binding protein [Coriobacteriales bacterium]|jgi:Fe-S oxidoreductase|nr:(Fe-S)-binding protein [Coriobacteriales bacterium]